MLAALILGPELLVVSELGHSKRQLPAVGYRELRALSAEAGTLSLQCPRGVLP
jgi:hypothetical protein